MERNRTSAQHPDDAGADDLTEGLSGAANRGLAHDLDQVDLAHAEDVGGDPPGGLGLDIGGGAGNMGADEAEQRAKDE